MEIGNHTYNHGDLRDATADVIRRNWEGCRLKSSSRDKGPCLWRFLTAVTLGTLLTSNTFWRGVSGYPMKPGCAPGWGRTCPSPYHQGFNRAAIPRIRGSEEELSKWLNYLESSGTRYVSDGNPDTIAIPEGRQDEIADTFAGIYELVVLPEQADTSP